MSDVRLRFARVADTARVAVAAPSGPIDAEQASALEALLGSPRGSRIRSWVLDLADVRYIHSYGMAYLVTLHDRLVAEGGTLLLANATPKVKVVLDLMGLTSLMKLHRSISGALASLGARVPVESRRSKSSG